MLQKKYSNCRKFNFRIYQQKQASGNGVLDKAILSKINIRSGPLQNEAFKRFGYIEQSWDGYLMNEVYNTGVFTWWIRYLEESGEREKVLKGDLTLMR